MRNKAFVLKSSLVAAMGGLLFGFDTAVISGTTEALQKHVREQIEIMKTGGGFVFQQVHNIQADVPVENIVAMFEAVKK